MKLAIPFAVALLDGIGQFCGVAHTIRLKAIVPEVNAGDCNSTRVFRCCVSGHAVRGDS